MNSPTTLELTARRVNRAMAAQVKRVNGDDPVSSEDVTLEQLLAEVRDQLAIVNKQLERVSEERDYWQEEAEKRHARTASTALNMAGRPLVTPAEFAHMNGASVATVNRRLNTGKLQGTQQANGRWLVYADQTIVRYSRKKGSK